MSCPMDRAASVWCRYNAVNFLTNIHERHPIASLLGRGIVTSFVDPASD